MIVWYSNWAGVINAWGLRSGGEAIVCMECWWVCFF